jgi:hypothetical protein
MTTASMTTASMTTARSACRRGSGQPALARLVSTAFATGPIAEERFQRAIKTKHRNRDFSPFGRAYFVEPSGTQVVFSRSYLNPGADFSASLVVSMVR